MRRAAPYLVDRDRNVFEANGRFFEQNARLDRVPQRLWLLKDFFDHVVREFARLGHHLLDITSTEITLLCRPGLFAAPCLANREQNQIGIRAWFQFALRCSYAGDGGRIQRGKTDRLL